VRNLTGILKICKVCGIEKDTSCFCKCVNYKDGLNNRCRDCVKEQYNKHRSEILEYQRIYRASLDKEEIKIYMVNYYIENRDYLINKAREYFYNNRERQNEVGKQYYELNKDDLFVTRKKYLSTSDGEASQARAYNKRRNKEMNVKNDLTSKQWKKILNMQNNKCAECGREFTENDMPTRDHIIPVSLGGGLTFGNVQALCRTCNGRKQNNIYFMKAISELIIECKYPQK
jgi:hypothetical protein